PSRTASAKTAAPPQVVSAPVAVEPQKTADLVPPDIQSLFDHARQTFDAGRYAQAADEMQQVRTRLNDQRFADSDAARALEARASDYLYRVASVRPDAARASADVQPRVPADVQSRVYSPDDRQVIAPIEILRSLPPWVEHEGSRGVGTYQG